MDITALNFGILSPAEVLSFSVCEVNLDKPKKDGASDSTLYDSRMGPVEDDIPCPTCKHTMTECPGHFGHITLNKHIIYPLPYGFKTVLNFLKCFCFQCSRLIFSRDKLDMLGLLNHVGMKRYNAIVDSIDKVEICWNCNSQIPKFFVHNPKADPKVMMFYKLLTEKKSKENSMEVSISDIERIFKVISDEDIHLFGFNPHRMRPCNLILSIIPVLPPCSRPYVLTNGERCEDDLTTIYRDIVKTNARILAAKTEEEQMKEVRSLSFYISVLMDNSKGRVKHPNGRPKKGIKERLAGKSGIPRGNLLGKRTNFSARTVVGGDPTLKANEIGVPLCISSRVTTPETVCRFNLGKLERLVNSDQAEFVMRTDMETGQKRKIILKIVRRGKTTPLFFGDKVYREDPKEEKEVMVKINDITSLRDGDRIVRSTGEEVIAEVGKPRHFKLQLGDEVHRHIQDGDIVLLNRQPTLHVGSILAGRAKIQPFRRTIGTPLNLTTPQNMDYDGDEVNLHMPQTLEAQAEYCELLAIEKNIISGQSSRPIMGIVQDALVGSYLMTHGWVEIKRERFFDICTAAQLDISRFDQVSRMYRDTFPDAAVESDRKWVIEKALQKKLCSLSDARVAFECAEHKKQLCPDCSPITDRQVKLWFDEMKDMPYHPYLFTGRGLYSLCLPQTFTYNLHNKAYESEPYLKIRNGVILEGSIDKSAVGPKAGAIHHYLTSEEAIDFLTKVQHTVNNWIREEGFSVGVKDCIPREYSIVTGMIPQAAEHMEKCYFRAQVAESTQSNPRIAEMKVTSALNSARDMGQKIAKESIPPSNRFLPLILSGSKGSLNNTTQIIAALGQQSVRGERLEETCLNGGRTFPHYDPETWTLEQKYESRGFVRHSFFCGLNPQEFWSHASGSREGIVNTATTTGKVGYFQRKLTEMLKNLTVFHDQTVRETNGRIIQFVYGGDGMAPVKQHRMDGGLHIHLATGIEALNAEYEIECYESGNKIETFRREHKLAISTVTEASGDNKEEASPVNSGASGSGNNTPDSIGTPGSADYDYDE